LKSNFLREIALADDAGAEEIQDDITSLPNTAATPSSLLPGHHALTHELLDPDGLILLPHVLEYVREKKSQMARAKLVVVHGEEAVARMLEEEKQRQQT
jgi:hypothetical protein